MRQLPVLLSSLLLLSLPVAGFAQSPQEPSVPRLINVTGVYRPADGQPAGAVATVTLSIYADQQGGPPLWQETQQVTLDAQGRYSLLLGATRPDGIPTDVFGGEAAAHWLGTVFERPGEVEGPRTRLTSVPYALRAVEADSLGGRPASDYQLAPTASGSKETSATAADTSGVSTNVVQPGTTNFLAKYVNNADVGNSSVFEAADNSIGLGTTTPFDRLHIRYDNNTGDFTGLAVQNTNGGALAYSGMLFYDHTNALTQFQGYNNATHEYRINNIARVAPGGAFNGSINFMIGGTSRFFVSSFGNTGIGTTLPGALLDVSNALLPTFGIANINGTTYGTNSFGTELVGRKARGTQAAPSAAQNGDLLALVGGKGYGATGFSTLTSGMSVTAAENWTDTAQGTQLIFQTIPRTQTQPQPRMVVDPNGNVGIGTFGPSSGLDVSNALSGTGAGQVTATTFTNAGSSLFVVSRARGTSAAPTAVLNGDNLGGFLGRGRGATNFSGTRGGMFVAATENWTDTAQGTRLFFNTTTNGTTAPATRMTIDHTGNVGIGTTNPGAPLEMVRNGETTIVGTSFNDADGSAVFFQRARGTQQTPAAVHAGDSLGYFGAGGYGATTWGDGVGVMAVIAAENWTDTANGSTVAFATTPLGTTDFVPQAAILPNGFLGLGTPGDVNGIPTATDRLQVFGDIRIGTTGTNGCIKNFAGTGIVGTCSSDRRLKKNITPFAAALDKVTALQPVHYFWRADEFPDRQFGDSRAYGLIAQDVEQVLPELVATDGDGYKAVDYSELPLLTIQAVKELKAGNDTLKAENDALKQRVAELEPLAARVAELERLMGELVAKQK
jgi:hypothetical protein